MAKTRKTAAERRKSIIAHQIALLLCPEGVDPDRCLRELDNGLQCRNKWKYDRDGKRYCGIHDPVKMYERRKKRMAAKGFKV